MTLICYELKFSWNFALDSVSVKNASQGWCIELCPINHDLPYL